MLHILKVPRQCQSRLTLHLRATAGATRPSHSTSGRKCNYANPPSLQYTCPIANTMLNLSIEHIHKISLQHISKVLRQCRTLLMPSANFLCNQHLKKYSRNGGHDWPSGLYIPVHVRKEIARAQQKYISTDPTFSKSLNHHNFEQESFTLWSQNYNHFT